MVECPTCGDEFDSDRAMKAHHQHHDQAYFDMVVRNEMGMEPGKFVQEYHRNQKLPLKEVGEKIGASLQTIKQMAERHGVDTLSRSESKEAMWERTDDPSKFLDAAHEKTREMVDNGEHNFQDKDFEVVQPEAVKEQQRKQQIPDELREWKKNNKDKVREFASRGADAREENGMAGKTGQDNPNWRGGKNILDAVKKQLPVNWREKKVEAKDKDNWTCQNCGDSKSKMDSHHIIPVMCGGTHGYWNLMTLCESCHTKAEQFIRQYPEFDPVLVE